jgi:hypothetical protein
MQSIRPAQPSLERKEVPLMTSRRIALAAAVVLVLALVPQAVAGKPAKPAGAGTTTSGAALTLVLLDSTDGLPHYGQNVTFTVSTSASKPFVNLKCYQGGDWVTNQTVGFYPGYPWSQVFPLSSYKWTGGAADCTARLYSTSGKKTITHATLSFHTYA